jgi:hypothetical protein
MVTNWVGDSASNYGLALNSDSVAGSNSYRFFASSESSDAARRPNLKVIYTINSVIIDNDEDGYTKETGDCNDNDASIHPGATEICGDGIDQNCDASDLTCPEDIDNDGDGYTENQGDCNDNDLSIHPAANEICGDGIDQDCSGIDENCTEQPQTAVLGDAPDTDYPGSIQDTFININQDVNVANDTLNTYTWPRNKPANAVLLKFDLSQLPAGAQIQSAILTLYQTKAGGDDTYDVSVHKLINANPDFEFANGYSYDGINEWTSNDVSFRNIPLAQADIAPPEDMNSLDQSLGYKNWNVTAMVRDWVSDSASNYGLMLNSDAVAAKDSYRYFAACEAIDAHQRPILEVVYTINNDDIDNDGDGYTNNEGDCNDNDATAFPGAIEICGDGIDQDCDGVDQACISEPRTVVLGDTPAADYTGTVHDTFININQDVNVFSDTLNTYTWPENMPANAVLLKFDLSWLPAGAQIQSATLRLYQIAAGGDVTYDLAAHKLIGVNPELEHATGYTYDGVNEWAGNDICYDSIPLAQSNIASSESVNSLDYSLGYKNWDLTSMVRDWVLEPSTNYGMMLNSDAVASSDSYRYFAATETEDAEKRPELVISFSIPAN